MKTVWSYGGGVQSVGIAALILQGRIPRPDYTVIADTGREVDTTWLYMREVVEPAYGPIAVASHDLATVDLYAKNGDLLIPAFTTREGKKGMLPTFCSNEWKQRVIRRWLRAQGIKKCEVWLGISTDEADRQKPSGVKWLTHRYPLIELGLSRQDCVDAIGAMGWTPAYKSRCYMCPHQSDQEWASLSFEDTKRAMALDDRIREKDPHVFVHRSCKPLATTKLDVEGNGVFNACDSGHCWT